MPMRLDNLWQRSDSPGAIWRAANRATRPLRMAYSSLHIKRRGRFILDERLCFEFPRDEDENDRRANHERRKNR